MSNTVCDVVNRRFDLPDHYYVYGLARPDGSWFYIGKGRRGRILKHFQPPQLKLSSHKNNVIRKYGKDAIIKEIFSYFQDEDSAYELEEFIISEIGIENLTNQIISRNELGKEVKGWDGWNKALAERTKYSEDTVVTCYRLYFQDHLNTTEISRKTGVPTDYVKYLVNGTKRKSLYNKYIVSGAIKPSGRNKINDRRTPYKVPDHELLKYYDLVVNYQLSIDELAGILGLHPSTIYSVYTGSKRTHLGLNLKEDRVSVAGHLSLKKLRVSKIIWFLEQGFSPSQVSTITGYSQSYVYKINKELKNGT